MHWLPSHRQTIVSTPSQQVQTCDTTCMRTPSTTKWQLTNLISLLHSHSHTCRCFVAPCTLIHPVSPVHNTTMDGILMSLITPCFGRLQL